MSSELTLVIILALIFEFLNGVRDSSNIVATMISSRAFRPQFALGLTAVAEFAGPFIFGVVVAKTIGSNIVNSQVLNLEMIAACLMGTILWNFITWFLGIPSSSSHALIGGLISVVIMSAGLAGVKLQGLYKVLIALFASPFIGFIVGFLVLRTIYFLAQNATPHINEFFKKGQLFTAIALAFSYGANDGQKTIGIITLSLIIAGQLSDFTVPLWVILISATAMALGTLLGGWRLIRTLGGKFYKIRPVHSFASQMTAALVTLSASFGGLPVSTTQVVSSAIIGVGSSERFGKVRWGVAVDILIAWLVTIPASALFSAGIYWLMLVTK